MVAALFVLSFLVAVDAVVEVQGYQKVTLSVQNITRMESFYGLFGFRRVSFSYLAVIRGWLMLLQNGNGTQIELVRSDVIVFSPFYPDPPQQYVGESPDADCGFPDNDSTLQ